MPAFLNPDVRNWMTATYPTELIAAKASGGSELDLSRIQNALMQRALEEQRMKLVQVEGQLRDVVRLLERISINSEALAAPRGYLDVVSRCPKSQGM